MSGNEVVMMKKGYVVILAAILAASVSACSRGSQPVQGNVPDNNSNAIVLESSADASETEKTDAASSVDGKDSGESSISQEETAAVNPRIGQASEYKVTAKKLQSLTAAQAEQMDTIDYENYTFTYKSKDKMGIFDVETGEPLEAKYTNISEEYPQNEEQKQVYYTVTTADLKKISNDKPDSYNCVGLINGKGKEMIPQEYASIEILNDRYAKVVKVSAVTTSKDEALVYVTDRMFAISAKEGDTLLKGTWEIFDMTTGQLVSGIKETKPEYVTAKGKFIKYGNKTVDDQGKVQGEDVTVLDYGYYVIEQDGNAVLYGNDSQKLFEFSSRSQSVRGAFENGLFMVMDHKDYKNYIVDSQNNRISGALESGVMNQNGSYFVMYGDTGYYICDKTGKKLLDTAYKFVTYNERYKVLIAETEDEYQYYDDELALICTIKSKEDQDNTVLKDDGLSYTKKDDKYIIKLCNGKTHETSHYPSAQGLFVYTADDGIYETVTGSQLAKLEEGNRNYNSSKSQKTLVRNKDGSIDIYEFTFTK